MDFYNNEGGKLRKKDKIAFYKNEKGKLTEIPKMTDEKEKVFPFLRLCVLGSVKDITDEDIQKVWEEAEEKKELVLAGLQQMKEEAEASGENTYKVIAYVKAIKAIKLLKVPVLSGEQAQKLPGIGPGIASVINEVLRSGRLKTQEERIESLAMRQPVIDLFTGVWGVTSKLASQWYNKGHRELEDLIEEASSLTNKQKLGIKYHKYLQTKVKRDKVEEYINNISNAIPKLKVEGIGPFRAGSQEVEEIEILVHGKGATLKKIVSELDSSGILVDVKMSEIKAGKFYGILSDGNNPPTYSKIEINVLPEKDIGTFLLFTTGPKNFLNTIKEQAAVLDYRLDKKGLVKVSVDDEERIPTPTEEDIFRAIGMDYIGPLDRN